MIPGCSSPFTDVDCGDVFFDDIVWLAAAGITRGCNPPANDRYCPGDPVTRGQMAAFWYGHSGWPMTAVRTRS